MDFSFIQITDHHLGPSEHAYNRGYATAHALGRVMDDIAHHEAHRADFLVCTGDLVNLGTDEEYAFAQRFLNIAERAVPPGPLSISWNGLRRFPAYFMPGNHDPRETFCRHLFPGSPSDPRFDVSFTHKGVQFVCLDWGTGPRSGEILPSTLDFVGSRLATGTPTVILLHHHPIPVGIPWLNEALPTRIQEFWNVIASGHVLGVLFGHAHTTVEAVMNGVPVLGLRSTSFQFVPAPEPAFCMLPPHYRVVSISGDRLTSRIYEVPL
jgi:Icc protein